MKLEHKITQKELKEHRVALYAKVKEFTDKQNRIYTKLCQRYIEQCIPFRTGQVIDITMKNKTIRMAIYALRIEWHGENAHIYAYGWTLDKRNNPKQFLHKGIYLHGDYASQYTVSLSENQNHNKPTMPQSEKAKQLI